MNKNGTVQVRMPEELKQEVNSILDTLGLTASEAIKLYYKQIALNNGIPFDIKVPNIETIQAIKEAREGKNTKSYDNVNELFTDLNR
ncbi:MAG: type II toxin-antitoxin system antitoxin, RelB/DinJ family [Denitrovibrio sp.]|nr:MAG: type II toxin-antitoxin system antitoxin, RelB/DinJ family [Denitrovibrio sp.]